MTPDWLTAVPIAHRGLHDCGVGRVPENSVPAFRAAIEAGYAMEMDIRLSKDGKPVVIHDERLERVTDGTGAVAERPLADLRRMKLGRSDHHVPALADVLDAVGGGAPVLLELKWLRRGSIELARAVRALLRDYDGAFAVQSFSPYIIGWFARHAPGIPRGQISYDYLADPRPSIAGLTYWHKIFLRRMMFNAFSRPHFIAYDVRALPSSAPLKARARGLPLLVWTVKDEADLATARRYADNIIFECLRPKMHRLGMD